jgi:sugar/nucleoside kinase (ribokinase family)
MNGHPHVGTLLRNQARKSAATEAARAVRAAARPRALIGFDGFLDVIVRAVDTRASMRRDDYTPIITIDALARRIAAAAGRSANIELVEVERRFGGNGPLLAGALASLGSGVTFIGCVGEDAMRDPPGPVHPAFEPFASRCQRVFPVARPALTHALEFGDGKIMLNMPQAIQGVTWSTLTRDLGLDTIAGEVLRADLIGVVNWSIMAGVESILTGLRDCLQTPSLRVKPRKRIVIDLSDPAKRTREDLRRVLALLASLQAHADVTLGLNFAESLQVAEVLGVAPDPATPQSRDELAHACMRLAASIRESLQLACVAIHPREGAAGATVEHLEWIDGPLVLAPRLSTGAGDHFNAGFAFAQALGCSLGACLAMGVGVSGAYVRDAASPDAERLAAFLDALPEPEPAAV